jgi:hypothetical protein
LRIILSAAAAVLLLWLADLVFQPVPLPAGGVVAGGLLGAWLSRGSVWRWVAGGAALGLVAGMAFHLYVHLTGGSPAPAEGLAAHLIVDGFKGLAVGLAVLLPLLLFKRAAARSTAGASAPKD